MVFYLTFSVLGAPMQDFSGHRHRLRRGSIFLFPDGCGVSPGSAPLLIDGVCAGVGSVLSFLPIIVLLFFFLSLLEDSGYMARVAFVMDKLLRKIGLSEVAPLCPCSSASGCSVPAIMATGPFPATGTGR